MCTCQFELKLDWSGNCIAEIAEFPLLTERLVLVDAILLLHGDILNGRKQAAPSALSALLQ